ncbi:uncharacterized protein APUU_22003S [Aspergillus puulaauensis]|uniref:Uncharacterized protein n=1 Tax=Aspergillus puulaauensis TaxID=1220207 RepID=A0A7R7XHJ6_9EURO|nr:uncharacterized protein APUU_22003S [Aspergillus puulaauensis]BCS21571.1 hypothetical protein APUU_22003S [Aspergillus puulaauensis]
MPSNPKNYTDPELREEVKNEVQQGDKGGKPGQWSARKAQLTASEYKARGGDYTTSKEEKRPEQKNLEKWTGEEWQTKEGSGTAKQDDGTRKRYLPKKAWEELDEGEKEKTEEKKAEGSKKGKQFVGNTAAAKRKRKEVSKDQEDEKEPEDESDEEAVDGAEDDSASEEKPAADDDAVLDEEEEGEEDEREEDREEDEEVEDQELEDDFEVDTPEGEQPDKKRQKKD